MGQDTTLENVEERLRSQIAEFPYRRLFVGFSGGLDSTVLLHVSWAVDADVTAVHVDHGLHPDAARWERHCAGFCRGLGVRFVSRRAAPEGGGEAQARAARYAVFEDLLECDDLLLLGHHRDDQAETVLLRLVQGRAPLGMPRTRRLQGGAQILRPWLSTPREALLRHARETGLDWMEDPTNLEMDFDRNFLRREIVPRLAARWPAVAGTLAASAATQLARDALLDHLVESGSATAGARREVRQNLGEDDRPPGPRPAMRGSAGARSNEQASGIEADDGSAMARFTGAGYAGLFTEAEGFSTGTTAERNREFAHTGEDGETATVRAGTAAGRDRELALEAFPVDLRVAVLRLWLRSLGEYATADRALAEFVRQFDAPPDAHPRLALEHGDLRRRGALAVYTEPDFELRSSYRLELPGVLKLPHGELVAERNEAGFHAEGPLEVRFRQGGESLRCGGRTRSVKKLLQAGRIPPWRRRTWPLIYGGGSLLAVPGIATADFPDRDPRWRVSWRPNA